MSISVCFVYPEIGLVFSRSCSKMILGQFFSSTVSSLYLSFLICFSLVFSWSFPGFPGDSFWGECARGELCSQTVALYHWATLHTFHVNDIFLLHVWTAWLVCWLLYCSPMTWTYSLRKRNANFPTMGEDALYAFCWIRSHKGTELYVGQKQDDFWFFTGTLGHPAWKAGSKDRRLF